MATGILMRKVKCGYHFVPQRHDLVRNRRKLGIAVHNSPFLATFEEFEKSAAVGDLFLCYAHQLDVFQISGFALFEFYTKMSLKNSLNFT